MLSRKCGDSFPLKGRDRSRLGYSPVSRWFRRSALSVSAIIAASSITVLPSLLPPLGSPAIASAAVTQPSPPVQPASGFGSNTPCSSTSMSVSNPNAPGSSITVYYPQGSAQTPLMGGTCGDSNRPVVAMVHGLDAGYSGLYIGIIDHLVSVGNIVIFATYNTNTGSFVTSYQDEDSALVTAVSHLKRDDMTRFGIVGHSMGGGATAYLAQHAASRGWGSSSFWVFALAPWYVAGVGTGTITFPSNARVIILNFDDDVFVDARIGIDYLNSLNLPPTQKVHVEIQSETRGTVKLMATHLSPNSIISPENSIKFYGIYRNADVLESCSIQNVPCDWSSLSYMGAWSDGQPATPAIISENPQDMGPYALAECTLASNPRNADCGPSIITKPA